MTGLKVPSLGINLLWGQKCVISPVPYKWYFVMSGIKSSPRGVSNGEKKAASASSLTKVTKQDPGGPSQDRAFHVLHPLLVCRKTLTSQAFPKFQRIKLTGEVRIFRNKGK